jgi:hypothetical protein
MGFKGYMIISIHQPQYMPWLGFFEKMSRADVFVLLDDVQYKKNEWQNRNQIKTAQGKLWITVPVMYHYPERIIDVKLNNDIAWQKQQRKTIELAYAKSPFMDNYTAFLDEVFYQKWERLDQINVFTVKKLAELLGIKTKIICSSEFSLTTSSTPRLVEICKVLSADTYIAGKGGDGYLNTTLFDEANIKLEFQEYQHPVYPQLYGEFVPNLSILDLLFNCGEKSLEILKGKA